MSFLRPLQSLIGMFQSLSGMLVSRLVVFFPVLCCGGTVRMCSQFVEFGSSLVRLVWHSVPYPRFRLHLRLFLLFPHCPIVNTLPENTPNLHFLHDRKWIPRLCSLGWRRGYWMR